MVSKIYIISDTHWNHRAMVDQGIRPADHGERTLEGLRKVMREGDTLIHLGDVIFARASELSGMLSSFPGTKILVRGNHDHGSWRWYQRHGFAMVMQSMSLNFDDKSVLLTHIPVPLSRMNGHDINIHGHLHQNTHRTGPEDRPGDWGNGTTHRLFTLEGRYAPIEIREMIHHGMGTGVGS